MITIIFFKLAVEHVNSQSEYFAERDEHTPNCLPLQIEQGAAMVIVQPPNLPKPPTAYPPDYWTMSLEQEIQARADMLEFNSRGLYPIVSL